MNEKQMLAWLSGMVAVLAFAAALSGCQTPQVLKPTNSDKISSSPTPSPTPIATPAPTPKKDTAKSDVQLAWSGKSGTSSWTYALIDALNASYLPEVYPHDIATFCPRYDKLTRPEKVEFFAQLVSKMAFHESRWNPKAIYRECSKKKGTYRSERYVEGIGYCMKGGHELEGGLVVSRGLLQMSFASTTGSYGCRFDKPEDINDPIKNLRCTVRILEKQVGAHDRLGGKVGEKWKGAASYWSVMRAGHSDSYPEIRKYVSGLDICK